jgi:hypothetical protein
MVPYTRLTSISGNVVVHPFPSHASKLRQRRHRQSHSHAALTPDRTQPATPVRRPLAEMELKSQIAHPRIYEMIESGRPYTIFGAAWAGDTDISEIWISLDGGASWVQGDFVDPINRHAWRRWKYDWITQAQPGGYTLLARAAGADQRAQPDGHNPNFGSYVINHPLLIEVFVAAI